MWNSFVLEISANTSFFITDLVKIELGREQTLARNGDGNAARVNCDPAPSPLLCNVSGRAAAASRIEYKVSRIGGHEYASCNRLCRSLYYIDLWVRKLACRCIQPNVVHRIGWKVI